MSAFNDSEYEQETFQKKQKRKPHIYTDIRNGTVHGETHLKHRKEKIVMAARE